MIKARFYGSSRLPYFEGWYLKCQTRDGRALALIPAVHQDRTGRRSASLQVLAEDGAGICAPGLRGAVPDLAGRQSVQSKGDLAECGGEGTLSPRRAAMRPLHAP